MESVSTRANGNGNHGRRDDISTALESLARVYLDAGLPLAPKDRQLACQLMLDIPAEKIPRIEAFVRDNLESGRWPDKAHTRSLLNVLRDGSWDVEIVKRKLPPPNGDRNGLDWDAVMDRLAKEKAMAK